MHENLPLSQTKIIDALNGTKILNTLSMELVHQNNQKVHHLIVLPFQETLMLQSVKKFDQDKVEILFQPLFHCVFLFPYIFNFET